MPYAPVNGTDLYYTDHGSGPAIVFAHGVGGNHASWHHQVPYFRRWYRVITPDVRGFGNTVDVPEGPSTGGSEEHTSELQSH